MRKFHTGFSTHWMGNIQCMIISMLPGGKETASNLLFLW